MAEKLRSINEEIPVTKIDQWIEIQRQLIDDAVENRDFPLLCDREQSLARLREYRSWLLAPVEERRAEAA